MWSLHTRLERSLLSLQLPWDRPGRRQLRFGQDRRDEALDERHRERKSILVRDLVIDLYRAPVVAVARVAQCYDPACVCDDHSGQPAARS